LPIPFVALKRVALKAGASHVVPVVVAAFAQWYRVMVNGCRQGIINAKCLAGLCAAYVASPIVAGKHGLWMHRRIEVAAVGATPFPVVAIHTLLPSPCFTLARIAVRPAARGGAKNNLPALAPPFASPFILASI
jgi:hypothetical protein